MRTASYQPVPYPTSKYWRRQASKTIDAYRLVSPSNRYKESQPSLRYTSTKTSLTNSLIETVLEQKQSTTIDLILDLQPQTNLYSTTEWHRQMEITYLMSLEQKESTPNEPRWIPSKDRAPQINSAADRVSPYHWTQTLHLQNQVSLLCMPNSVAT